MESAAYSVGAVDLVAAVIEQRIGFEQAGTIEIAAGDFGSQLRVFAAGVAETQRVAAHLRRVAGHRRRAV